jgi:hypothetical protein
MLKKACSFTLMIVMCIPILFIDNPPIWLCWYLGLLSGVGSVQIVDMFWFGRD